MEGIVYCATNTVNGKAYIGQTIQSLADRKYKHMSDANMGRDYYFGRALLKYGLKGFDWEVLCQMDVSVPLFLKECLNTIEQVYIKHYKSNDNTKGYNCTSGGGGIIGFHFKHSEETKRKLSECHRGIKASKKTRAKMSESRVGLCPNEATKVKMSKSRMGIRYSEETKRKMSESKKGKNHPMFGKKFSDDRRRKISEGNRGKIVSLETRRKISESLKRRNILNKEKIL